MASMHPTEEQYTAAMERHGTPAWTADDERTQQRWVADRTGGAVEPDDSEGNDTEDEE